MTHHSKITIEKNVPQIARQEGVTKAKKYPLADMDIGDSFFVAGANHQSISGCFLANRPKKFSVRTLTENGVMGVRVWRVS